jgi:hypothetical protein
MRGGMEERGDREGVVARHRAPKYVVSGVSTVLLLGPSSVRRV